MKKFKKHSGNFLYVHFILYTYFIVVLSVPIMQAQFVTNHNAIPQPVVQKPPLMVQTTDPKFGSKIIRLSDARSQHLPGIVPQYSKRQAWNANDSLLLLISGNGNTLLYDGKTYQFIRELNGVFGEDIFWHPLNPNAIICTNNQALLSYNVLSDHFDTLAVFSQYNWFNTRGEGNLSNDGRYYAFVGQTYDSTVHFKDIVVYDLIAKKILKTMSLPETLNDFDWVSISPLGNYVVIDFATMVNARYNGIEVYDRNMNFIWQKPIGAGHSDLGFDANGDEILVFSHSNNLTIG